MFMWLTKKLNSSTSEFSEVSYEVSEPEDSATTSVNLVVERRGGATGVVEVSWSVSASNGELHMYLPFDRHGITTYLDMYIGEDPSPDIVPVSGSLQFISNVTQRQITLSINADDIPEVAEV